MAKTDPFYLFFHKLRKIEKLKAFILSYLTQIDSVDSRLLPNPPIGSKLLVLHWLSIG